VEVGKVLEADESYRYPRLSDIFPTNNVLVRRSTLGDKRFDPLLDGGRNEDEELGRRLQADGALMVLNPAAAVVHHHAMSGGLRTTGARAVTYSSSRMRLLHRNLPSASELYIYRRFHSQAEVREVLWLAALGTFSIRGGVGRRALKAALASVLLPSTIRRMRSAWNHSSDLLATRAAGLPGPSAGL
jgi:GT2 family glycosyltransferase